MDVPIKTSLGKDRRDKGGGEEGKGGRGFCGVEVNIPLLPLCIQSTPNRGFFSLTCLDLIEANVSIGLKPEFSAKAIGTESRASANARMAYCSMPGLYMKFRISWEYRSVEINYEL